jgi:hypothetical protein
MLPSKILQAPVFLWAATSMASRSLADAQVGIPPREDVLAEMPLVR